MKVLIIILIVNSINLTKSNLDETLNYDNAKRVKIKLANKTKFKEYIIKVDSLNVYSVAKKEMIQEAVNNNCGNCRITPINQIKRVKSSNSLRRILSLVIGGIGLIIGFITSIWFNDTLEGGFPFLSQLLLTIILSGFFLGLGYLIGLNLDNANPNKSKEKELIYLKENSIHEQYYNI